METSLFQTPEWEQFKCTTGYQKSYRVDDVLVLQKQLPLGRSLLYSPMLNSAQKSVVRSQSFLSKIKDIARETNSIFYRLEIDDSSDQADSYKLKDNGFVKAFEEMQPEHTLMLDISKSEQDILAQMKQKGRYNIKIAEKHQIRVVEEVDAKNFFDLYSTMAKRHKITYRGYDYFQKLIDIMLPKGYVKVFTAMHNNTAIASVIIAFYGSRAIYLFGGSSDSHRNLMAPYLLQWTAIQKAKNLGCTEYDFFGIAPAGASNHPWAGVTDFKKKFGGQEVELLGSWDLVLRPLEYQLFEFAEKIRRD